MEKIVANFSQKLTLQNCCSKASPGESQSGVKEDNQDYIEAARVAVTADQTKDLFDPSVVSNRRNGLGISLSAHQTSRELLKKTSSSTVTN